MSRKTFPEPQPDSASYLERVAGSMPNINYNKGSSRVHPVNGYSFRKLRLI